MRKVALSCLLVLLVAGVFAQSETRPDTDTPIPFEPIQPEYPADFLSKFRGRELIHLFIEVDYRGRVQDVEAFGPWLTCGKDDPVAEGLEKAAVEAVKRTTFIPGRRLGQPADAPLIVVLELIGTKPEAPPEKAKGIKGGVVNGKAISLPKPKYPKRAREYRIEGTAQIELLIDEEGSIISTKAKSGHPLLLKPAALAACDARFTPTLLSGVPVKVGGIISFNFKP